MSEPIITINGKTLDEAESMTVRVAIQSLINSIHMGLGDDDHGRAMTKLYLTNCKKINNKMRGVKL